MTDPSQPIHRKDPVTGPEPTPAGPPDIEEEHPSKTFDVGAGKAPTPGAEGPSPMDVAAKTGAPQMVTPQVLEQQSTQLQAKAQALTQALDESTYNKLSDGQKALMMTKAHQYAEQLGHISNMTGGKFQPEELKPGVHPQLKKIIGWFDNATKTLKEGGGIGDIASDKKMNVTDMLRIEARLNAADRAVNFASAVVGKFSDALKQLGQTQI